MRRSTTYYCALFAIVLWSGTAISALVHAQKQEAVITKSTTTTTAAAPDATLAGDPKSEPGQMSEEAMLHMLTNMGYEIKPVNTNAGVVISMVQGTWKLDVEFVISPNHEKIGMNVLLGTAKKPEEVTAAEWEALLVRNGNIEPSFFYFDKTNSKLFLHRVIDNRGITPAILRRELDVFTSQVHVTQKQWKFVE